MAIQAERITASVQMEEPNESIIIYKGVYTLSLDTGLETDLELGPEIADIRERDVEGILKYEWFPSSGVRFSGIMQGDWRDANEMIKDTYMNRCSHVGYVHETEEYVPWSNKQQWNTAVL